MSDPKQRILGTFFQKYQGQLFLVILMSHSHDMVLIFLLCLATSLVALFLFGSSEEPLPSSPLAESEEHPCASTATA